MTNHTLNEKINKVTENIGHVIVGKEHDIELSLVALLVKGHVLLEGVPGVGKTMLVRALAQSIDCEFSRIQFTPDLLPSDITGVSIYQPQDHTFEFYPGPLLSHVVLADEINRTSPRTQSSLLEAMAEGSVTVDGQTHDLDDPFLVMATQNPLEFAGTYPLPEAQLDRFLFKLTMDYPSESEEVAMLKRLDGDHPIDHLAPVMTQADLLACQKEVANVHIADNVLNYIVQIVARTRSHPMVYLGVSPRGSEAIAQAAKARAFLDGRDFVLPDDVKYLMPYICGHRMILTDEATFSAIDIDAIMQEILNEIDIPMSKGMEQ